MFKAKLIENESYYALRSKQVFLMLLPAIPMGLIVNYFQFPTWAVILTIGLYLLAIFMMSKNQKKLNAIVGNKQIEMDEKEIRIKTKKGKEEEIIALENVDKLILTDTYSMPQETMREVGKEMAGNTKQNYLIVQQNNNKRKLDFEIDSYFMIKQLDKIIEKWELNGYNIEREG